MIRFDHVSKTYPGGTRAVEDFSLTIEQGSTTVFLGTSGCGKTTLMRMVNAMVTPTSGTVFVRGEDVAGKDPVRLRRSIGYVLQEGGLFPHRSIADNIATVPRLEGVSKAESRERALELLTLVGLARSTVNEPKTEDTDRILAAGLRLAADPEAAESALLRMTDIVEAEKHRVAPNCAACAMPCGNTSNYDLARLWGAPAEICALKVRLLSAVCVLAGQKTTAQIQKEICDDLFVLAEDWDTELLLPIVTRAEGLCAQ